MVIRMRHTRAHTANRRSHHALKAPALSVCANCEAKHRPHHMCLECGFYKGKMVVDMAAKKQARTARIEAKQAAIAEQTAQFAPQTEATPEPKAVEEAKAEKKPKAKKKAKESTE